MIWWLLACNGETGDSAPDDTAPTSTVETCDTFVAWSQGTAHTIVLGLDAAALPEGTERVEAEVCYDAPDGSARGCHTWSAEATADTLEIALLPPGQLHEVVLSPLDAVGEVPCTLPWTDSTHPASGHAPAVVLDVADERWLDDPAYLVRPYVPVNAEAGTPSLVTVWDPFGYQVAEVATSETVDAKVRGELILALRAGSPPSALTGGEEDETDPSGIETWDLHGELQRDTEIEPAHHRFEPLLDEEGLAGLYGLGFRGASEQSEACGENLLSSTVFYDPLDGEATVLWNSMDHVTLPDPADCGFVPYLNTAGTNGYYLHYANSWDGPEQTDWGCLTMAATYSEWEGGACLQLDGDTVVRSVAMANDDVSWSDLESVDGAPVFEDPHSMSVWDADGDVLTVAVYNRNVTDEPFCSYVGVHRVDLAAGTIEQLGRYPAADDSADCIPSESHGNVVAEATGDGWRVLLHHGEARRTQVLEASADFATWELIAELAPVDAADGSPMRPTFASTARDIGDHHEATWSWLP